MLLILEELCKLLLYQKGNVLTASSGKLQLRRK